MKSKLVFFFLFIQCSFMSAQTVNINTVEVCAVQEVLLPVTGASLLNVGAITLYIAFDTTKLTFVSVENIDPLLAGMSTNMMTEPPQLAFAWSSTLPVDFLNARLFDIKFITNGQTTAVDYNSGCEIADIAGLVIPAAYINGAVNSGLPSISLQPKDTIITEGGSAVFSVESANATSYFWRESQDNGTSWLTLEDEGIYAGTHSEMLAIFPSPLSLDKNLYQCILLKGNCQTVSDPAMLTVDALTSTGKFINPNTRNLVIAPVPFNDLTSVQFTLPENGDVALHVMNCLGNLVTEIKLPSQNKGHQNISLNTSGWQPGVYFVKLSITSANHKSNQVVKVIKRK